MEVDTIIRILKKHYKEHKTPVSQLILKKGVTPFEILISIILSSRTKDEITSMASKRLFKNGVHPMRMLSLGVYKIEKIIYPVGFYHVKAMYIIKISKIIIEKYHTNVPFKMKDLLTLPGVGRKTANLVLLEGFKIPSICVDTHVHRISNRIGYVNTNNYYETESVLRSKLPKIYWPCYNRLIVGFGQMICKPISPYCSLCPIFVFCMRFKVKKYR